MRCDELAGNEFKPKPNVLARLRKDCEGKYHGCKTPVVMGFVGDIYQPHAEGDDVTREALQLMADNGLVPIILTKGGTRACRDFDLLKAAGGWFGQTISFWEDQDRERWEPHASSIDDRIEAFEQATEAGIRTWISVEPVIDPLSAHRLISCSESHVDHFKLGKLNGYDAETRAIEKSIDWPAYRQTARQILNDAGYMEITTPGAFEVGTYYVKAELRDAT